MPNPTGINQYTKGGGRGNSVTSFAKNGTHKKLPGPALKPKFSGMKTKPSKGKTAAQMKVVRAVEKSAAKAKAIASAKDAAFRRSKGK